MSTMPSDSGPPVTLNSSVDGLIAAGRYREALELPARFNAYGLRDTCAELLVQINLAEAEYNLGRWDAAWDRLRGLDPLAAAFPIARAGLSQQRSWIAAHTGKPDEAVHHWRRAELRDLPPNYHAEHFFTGAIALLGVGKIDAARECSIAGSGASVRPSSKRNSLFIRARVAAAMDEWERAEVLCRTAAENPYRAAGGEGLLFWGGILARLGRSEEARNAFALAVERDSESESAAIAEERLMKGSNP
jgi:tetratricopeptide (TPR) repeat protein